MAKTKATATSEPKKVCKRASKQAAPVVEETKPAKKACKKTAAKKEAAPVVEEAKPAKKACKKTAVKKAAAPAAEKKTAKKATKKAAK